ncbi:hypothetical protein OHB00_06165 [Streptomyces sp. NBC_00631]
MRDALPSLSPHTLTSRPRRFERHGIVAGGLRGVLDAVAPGP